MVFIHVIVHVCIIIHEHGDSLRLRNSVKYSGYSRVTSNFISVYAYGAQSSASFLYNSPGLLGDERS